MEIHLTTINILFEEQLERYIVKILNEKNHGISESYEVEFTGEGKAINEC